jgi:hypothetical protein
MVRINSMFALVMAGNPRVFQVSEEAFDVAPPFEWVSCGADITTEHSYEDGAFAPPSTADLASAKDWHARQVDAEAEAQRLRYITPGAGQAMTYAEKAAQAKAALASDDPLPEHYPLLAAEIGITADTLEGVAEVVDAAYRQWLTIGGMIEAVRLSAKKAIASADTLEAVSSAFASISWPTPAA